ncbi:hypothetical protein [Streptomyces sp. KR80]|uniref:hypothetical protein n=1 Tax=Streptomyces sp. KR80 TaxID=3457426 RepID=UPI003FD37BDF
MPEGWKRSEESSEESREVFYRSPGKSSLIQVFSVDGPEATPYGSLKEAEKSLKQQLPGYQRIRLERFGSGDDTAAELEYVYDSEEHGRRRVLDSVFIGADGVRYAVLVADPAEDRAGQRARQHVVLRSFCPTPYCGT